ncbi:MAG: hypothetical protein ACQ9MH_15995 [Nitrospinales bacterium]
MDDFFDGLRYDKNGKNLKPGAGNNHNNRYSPNNRKSQSSNGNCPVYYLCVPNAKKIEMTGVLATS